MRVRNGLLFVLVVAGAVVLGGCDKKDDTSKKSDDVESKEEDKGPALDPNLAEATEALETAADEVDPTVGPGGGPPPNGILEPGKADAEAKSGDAPKVAVGQKGNAPRVRVVAAPEPGSKQKATLRLATRVLPPVDLALALEAKKPKEGEAFAPGAVAVNAKITGVELAPGQPGATPKELEVQAKKLRGKTITYQVLPNGAGVRFAHSGAADDAAMNAVLDAIVEGLRLGMLPVPDEPLGTDGLFMVTSRGPYNGGDVVTYRLVRVKSAAPGRLELSLSTKRYAAEPKLSGAVGYKVLQFMAQSEGEIVLEAGKAYPVLADVKDQAQIILQEEGAPEPQPGVPVEGVKPLQHVAVTRFALVEEQK